METKLKWLFLVLALVVVFGTLGFALLEGWSILDSLYMTIITLSTVGYKEAYPLSIEGKFFAIILIIFGAGKLPEIGKGLGKGIRNFRKATTGMDEVDESTKGNEKELEDKEKK